MIRALIMASPERLDAVRAAAIAADPRFGSIAVRCFAIRRGVDACPPGLAFVGALEACPDAFIDSAFLEPDIETAQHGRINRCLAPGAEIHGGNVHPPRPARDLDEWWRVRGPYMARLLGNSRAKAWLQSTARLDDLALEAIETHADRLFGQPRSRTLVLPRIEIADRAAWSGLPLLPAAPEASLNPGFPALDRLIAEATARGREIAMEAPPGQVSVNVVGSETAAIVALGLAEGLSSRSAIVRVVDRSAARLGAFLLVYREARFLFRRRIAFRWCPEPEQMPPVDMLVTESEQVREKAFGAVESGGATPKLLFIGDSPTRR